MERLVSKQTKFGRSCTRCKVYFVTEDETNYLCPWCMRVESGEMKDDAFILDDSMEL